MNTLLRKTILASCIAVLALAALPASSVFASDENPPRGEVSNERLERAWAHQLKRHARLGKVFENMSPRTAKLQALIDKAAAGGKDTAAVQAALNAFEAALNNARPAYESTQVIVNAHSGFDENGKVTDSEQAKSTALGMRAKMREIKSLMNGTGKALRAAVKDFRKANKPTHTRTTRDR